MLQWNPSIARCKEKGIHLCNLQWMFYVRINIGDINTKTEYLQKTSIIPYKCTG